MEFDPNIVAIMKPGDIIQYHNPDFPPPWNMCYWSHTMLYAGNNRIIEAGHTIKESDIFEYFRHQGGITNYAVIRVKNISQDKINNVVQFARNQLGKPYDSWSIWRLTKQLNPPPDHPGFGYYCTELVWASYMSQGIDLDSNGFGTVNPIDIWKSPLTELIYIINMNDLPFFWRRR